MFKIHNHSCCNDMFSLACQQQIPKKLRLVPLKLYLSFEGLDFHILGTLGYAAQPCQQGMRGIERRS